MKADLPTRAAGFRPRGRPVGRPAKTRAQVVEAAAATFARLGYQNARMDDVAEALGVTKGSLYYYVDSKEQLLFDVILPPYRDAVTHLGEVLNSGLPADVGLIAVIGRYVANVVRYYPAISIYVAGSRQLPVPSEIRALDADYVAGLHRLVAEGIAAGALAAVEPAVALFSVLGVCNGFAQRYSPELSWDLDRVSADISAILLTGLGRQRKTPLGAPRRCGPNPGSTSERGSG